MSGEESDAESVEEDDLDDEALDIQTNLTELESKESIQSSDLLGYSYTRLPCAAHKVRLDYLLTHISFPCLLGSLGCWKVYQQQVSHLWRDSEEGTEICC